MTAILRTSGILLLIPFVGAAACGGASSPRDDGGPSAGVVWLEGDWLEEPPTIEAAEGDVLINGTVVRTFNPEPAGAAGDTELAQAIQAVAGVLQETGGPWQQLPNDGTLDRLVATAAAMPGIAAASVLAGELRVTAASGEEAAAVLLLQPEPVAAASAAAEAEAQRLRDAVAAGEVLLFSNGAGVEVPVSEATAFLDEVRTALAVDSANRLEALLDVVGSFAVATRLLDSGQPPGATMRPLPPGAGLLRPPARPTAIDLLVSRDPVIPVRAPLAAAGAHGQNRTPSSNIAFLFMPITVEGPGWCEEGPVIKAAKLHGYKVVHLRGKASTIDELAASSGRAGIFYRCAHGSTIEPADSVADAMKRQKEYLKRFRGVNWSVTSPSNGPFHYVSAWPGKGFYQAHWKSANTIAFMATCNGTDIIADMKPREGIAVPQSCYPYGQDHLDEMTAFFGRLDGTVASGRSRPVGVAFREALKSPWRLAGGGTTVLSPAVARAIPDAPVPVSPTVPIRGSVTFDAQADQAFLGHRVERILTADTGCGATIVDRVWIDPYTMAFTFTTTRTGTLTFTINSTWLTSKDDLGLKLDGNTDPERTDHVGPNHDNFVWKVQCRGDLPTPTPGAPLATATRTSTSTPTSAPASNETPTPTPPSVGQAPTPTVGSPAAACQVALHIYLDGEEDSAAGPLARVRLDITDDAGTKAEGYTAVFAIDKGGLKSQAQATTGPEGRITLKVSQPVEGDYRVDVSSVSNPEGERCDYAPGGFTSAEWASGAVPTPTFGVPTPAPDEAMTTELRFVGATAHPGYHEMRYEITVFDSYGTPLGQAEVTWRFSAADGTEGTTISTSDTLGKIPLVVTTTAYGPVIVEIITAAKPGYVFDQENSDTSVTANAAP